MRFLAPALLQCIPYWCVVGSQQQKSSSSPSTQFTPAPALALCFPGPTPPLMLPCCCMCVAQNEYCLLSDMQKGFKVLMKLIELNNK